MSHDKSYQKTQLADQQSEYKKPAKIFGCTAFANHLKKPYAFFGNGKKIKQEN